MYVLAGIPYIFGGGRSARRARSGKIDGISSRGRKDNHILDDVWSTVAIEGKFVA